MLEPGQTAGARLQKINHFAGMLELCRKKPMARLLTTMAARLPSHFFFCPTTYLLPEQLPELKAEVGSGGGKSRSGKKGKAWILKPDSGCQGRGIAVVMTGKQLGKVCENRLHTVSISGHAEI